MVVKIYCGVDLSSKVYIVIFEEVCVMVIDDYLVNNVDYVSGFKGLLLMLLSKYIVIVVCMDVWLDVYCMLGIKEGEVYVICNVGCVVIDDVICLLVIS